MERIRMENLEGRHLLVTDLSELGPEEATALLQQTHLVPSRLPRERSVLSLAIVRGLRMGTGRTFNAFESEPEARAWLLASATKAA